MYVKNVSAHMITVNAGGKSVQMAPGSKEVFELTKDQADTQFVKSLLARDELVEVAAPKDKPKQDDEVQTYQPNKLPVTEPAQVEAQNESSVEELRAQLDGLGVKYDKRWGAERLQQEIDTALDE